MDNLQVIDDASRLILEQQKEIELLKDDIEKLKQELEEEKIETDYYRAIVEHWE